MFLNNIYKYPLILTLSLFLTSCADKNIFADMTKETNITANNQKIWYRLVDKLENSKGIVLKSAYKSDLKLIFSNTDPVCAIYMDALNKYEYYGDSSFPPPDIFFDNPMRPKISDFKFPEWRQLDIYEHKDLYLKIWGKVDGILTEEQRAKLEKSWMMQDNRSQEDKESNRRMFQMYYTRFDIDQDGISENIVRLDGDKYVRFRDFAYTNRFIIFKDKEEMSFKYMDRGFSDLFYGKQGIRSLFSYKGKSYVTEVRFNMKDYIYPMGFYYLIIKELNSDKKLENLCLITSVEYEGWENVK